MLMEMDQEKESEENIQMEIDQSSPIEAANPAVANAPVTKSKGVMRALLWKNMILKRRRWKSTLCECLLPAGMILLLLYLKSLSNIVAVDAGWEGFSFEATANVLDTNFFDRISDEDFYGGTDVGRLCLAHSGNTAEEQALNELVEFLRSDYVFLTTFSSGEGPFADIDDRIHIEGGGSEEELNAYLTDGDYVSPFIAERPLCIGALVIDSVDFSKAQFEYTIRGDPETFFLPYFQVFRTEGNAVDFEQGIDIDNIRQYTSEGFSNVQQIVDSFLIEKALVNYTQFPLKLDPTDADVIDERKFFQPSALTVIPMPTNAFEEDEFFAQLVGILPLVYVMVFLMPVSQVIAVITLEKESRSREMMNLMGISDFKIILSWYITYAIIFFFLAFVVAITAGGLFPSTAEAQAFPLALFFTFFLYGMTVVSYAFVVSTFFWKSFNAVVMGLMGYMVLFFVFYVYQGELEIPNLPLLVPQVAFSLTIDTFVLFESAGVGVAGNTVSTQIVGFDVLRGILWMVLDIFLWTGFGFYVNAVFPRKFGSTLPWYFLVWPDYWKAKYANFLGKDAEMNADQADLIAVEGDNFETPNDNLKDQVTSRVGIQIRGMTKDFGTKRAVDDVNLDVFENQILVLLGHNGAGKSTSLQMLTGSLNMSSGEAYIYGDRVRTSLGKIRGKLGFCPQHNLLYKELTVYEHLKFYGMVKGKRGKELKAEVEKSILQVGLWDKKNVKSAALSGGMKRKLSLAISLVGGSKVILVDEPTSGVDTYSRRSMWEVLQNARDGRVIILTTHFMDEADLLGDRIAIMSEGKLQCVGSNLFLKELYNTGYRLVFNMRDSSQETEIEELIMAHVKGAIKASDVGTELSFSLPISESGSFGALFAEIDNKIDSGEFAISDYGISVSTMEEVFLKAGRSTDLIEGEKNIAEAKAIDAEADDGLRGNEVDFESLNPFVVFFRQFFALLEKRLRYSSRDSYSCICNTLVPTVILIFGLFVLVLTGAFDNQPRLVLEADVLNPGLENFIPIVELNNAGEQLTDGRFSQNGMFRQFQVEDPVETLTTSPSGIREVFDIEYVDGQSDTCFNGYYTFNCVLFPDKSLDAILDLSENLITPEPFFATQQDDRNGASIFASLVLYPNDDLSDTRMSYTLQVNTTATHIVPIMLAETHTALLRRSIVEYLNFTDASFDDLDVSNNDNGAQFGADEAIQFGDPTVNFAFPSEADAPRIRVSSLPLPNPPETQQIFDAIQGFTAAIFSVLAFGFVAAPVIAYVVMEKEEEVQIKHLQFVSGTGIIAYWLSNFVFDLFRYLIPFCIAITSIKFFNVNFFVENGAFKFVVIAFFGYGFAVIPFSYLLSFLFKKSTSAITWVILINSLGGLVLMIVSFTLDLLENTTETNKSLKFLYRLFPSFCFGDSLLQIAVTGIEIQFGIQLGYYDYDEGPVISKFSDSDVTGANFGYMFITGFLYLFLVIFIEFIKSRADLIKYFSCTKDPGYLNSEVDEDVRNENERLQANQQNIVAADQENQTQRDVLELVRLRKVYGSGKVAVEDVSLGIPAGECFGYLGVNGAGKTTTMKCLTGDVFPTNGKGYIKGHNVVTDQWKVRQNIGYCSQFSSILGLLTVKEHLVLFCRIKQIPNVQQTVQTLMQRMSLSVFENTLSQNLSGGNKRKLSVAIAMVGSPTVMLLDEPSTGMDVASRRFMWNVISNMVAGRYTGKQTSVVLTTHSMEECEALCSRLAIMVDGSLKCLGSVQHLKTRFGRGYTIEVKLDSLSVEEMHDLKAQLSAETQALTKVYNQQVEGILQELGLGTVVEKMQPANHAAHGFLNELNQGGISLSYLISWAILQDRIMALETFLKTNFEGVEVTEAQDYRMTYRVAKNNNTRLSTLFEAMEERKEELHISQYSVSQTTLEQIFNGFAETQDALAQEGALADDVPTAEPVE